MPRSILHLDMDTFFVSVERLLNSSLANKPVIIGGSSDRGVVASCSYEARRYGVHSAMPMKMARQLCPDAIIIKGDYDQYSKYSQIVTDILRDGAPVVEKASIDEHYIDLSGMDKYFGCLKWAARLRQKVIAETGLPISFGLSENKTVSKIATGEAKPNGQLNVQLGNEKIFLAPLSVKKIPMIGEKTFKQLRDMGVSKIATLQQIAPEQMQRIMGDNGISIWRKANGIDKSPVVPYHERKSMSNETTFDKDTIDIGLLERTILKMTDSLAFDLRKDQKLCGCITVKIRYSNFDTATKQAHISYTASDRVLSRKALELFRKLYEKRMMLRLVGVKLSDIISGSFQIDLFNDAVRDINLAQAMDGIRKRYGYNTVKKAVIM